MSAHNAITAADIAQAMGMSVRGVRKRADAERWAYAEEIGRAHV
jgi:DNA-directed RNA polymerase specialized sigma24 family protein